MNETILVAIKDRFNSLPKDMQDAITSSKYQQTLLAIGQKHKLTVEDIGKVEQETTFVLLGIVPARDYAAELKSQLKIDESVLNEIITEVNAEIFVPIRDILMDLEEAYDKAQTEAEDEQKKLELEATNASKALEEKRETEKELSLGTAVETKVESRDTLISGIENPPKAPELNLAALKLTSAHSVQNSSTTVTTPNLSTPGNNPPPKAPPTSAPKSGDPYREMPE